MWPAFIKHAYVTPCFWGLSTRPARFICQYSLFSGKRAVYRCHERCLSPSASAKSELVFWLRRGQGAALTCILFFSLLSWLCIQFPESSLASSHRHDRAKGKETEWKKGAGGGSAKVYLWKWFVSMATRGSWKMDLQCNSNQPHLVEFVLYYCSYRRALVDSGKLAVQCLVERTVVKSFSRPIIMHSSDVMDLS